MPLTQAIPGDSALRRIALDADCIHCGTRFFPTPARPEFCCAGCQFVHGLIVGNGLEKFYDLRDGAPAPVQSLVFRKRDYDWLSELVKAAESSSHAALTLDLQGISCVGCVWLIEKLFARKPGALSAEVNSTLGQISLRWITGECDIIAFARELQSFGYLVGPLGKQSRSASSALVTRMGVCGAFAMNAMLFSIPRYLGMDATFAYAALFDRLALIFATLSIVVGGSYFFTRTWSSLRNGVLHIDLPISLGLVAAYAGSVYAWSHGAMNFAYFDFVSTFTFLMLAGRWTQQTAIEKNRVRLLSAIDESLHVFCDGAKTPAADLRCGMRYQINPGQVIPVRSKLRVEAATLGLEWINGESEAHTARLGQLLPSGAVNCSQSAIELEAIEPWAESLLSSLLQTKPRANLDCSGLERFIKIYIVVVIAVAVAGFGAWLTASHSLLLALQVLTSILVVSCPCAAGVALPFADELAVSTLRKHGVFVREQSLWARLPRVRRIIFDKTGTLTLETMALRNPDAFAALTTKQKAVLLAMVENNLHPVSCCLRETLMAAGIASACVDEPKELVGAGIELQSGSGVWRLGKSEWARRGRNSPFDCVFTLNGDLLAEFSFCEQIRADAAREIARMQRDGFRVHILSGDRDYKVAQMARQIGLAPEDCHGEMSPAEKAQWLRKNGAQDTLTIGDGANDSLAFNESFCTGTPAIDRSLLQQKSDFYFLGRGLSGVRKLLEVARGHQATVRRVIAFAIAYNLIAILLSLAGKMNPLAAAILMPTSSLVSLMIVLLSKRNT
jgi:Cu2+-exporting ATPase